jgi:hypothetical protein
MTANPAEQASGRHEHAVPVPTDAVAQTVNHRLPIFSAAGAPVTHHRSERTTAHLPRVKGLFGSHSSLFLHWLPLPNRIVHDNDCRYQ